MYFSKHILVWILVPFFILTIAASFMRFVVLKDFTVQYEVECDPYTSSCFIGCENEECSEEYYFSYMLKYASDVINDCGEDITDCEAASTCKEDDFICEQIYCEEEDCAFYSDETPIIIK